MLSKLLYIKVFIKNARIQALLVAFGWIVFSQVLHTIIAEASSASSVTA